MSLFRAPLVLIAMLSYQASLAVSKVANKADRERAVDVSVASVDRPVHATLIFNRVRGHVFSLCAKPVLTIVALTSSLWPPYSR
ncbi:hypothetical protein FA95DRAFT_1553430 [Auriscalpium vulgare]|uniref:Uncharacterized protein n=1 Tax=Auriscalpium vulgare TaxID=40419 RepID=A0ACB8S7E5_9AGAM|nr:hypothetical protein FA95DRAFT_1553430 [Auriscalpium vulgare]